MLQLTSDEVRMLIIIAAVKADEILDDPENSDKLKAAALKCRAVFTEEPLDDGRTFIKTPAFMVIGELA